MKIKTYRFAAAVAVLLALCLVFMAPVGAEDNVAKVGTQGFTTLKDAVDEAKAGTDKTVTLIKDIEWIVTGDGWDYIDSSGITIDLNQNNITVRHAGFTGSDFTIKNGTFKSHTSDPLALHIGNFDTYRVLVEDIDVEGSIEFYGAKIVKLIDVDATGFELYGSSNIIIQSGSIETLPSGLESGVITVFGGSFSSDPSAYLADSCTAPIVGGKYVVSGPTGTVANIGDVSFASLNDAINFAWSGDTITLLNDVDLGPSDLAISNKKFTLDLNEFEISGSSHTVLLIQEYSDITIQNGKIINSGSGHAVHSRMGAEVILNGVELTSGGDTLLVDCGGSEGASTVTLNENTKVTTTSTSSNKYAIVVYGTDIELDDAVPQTTTLIINEDVTVDGGISGNGGYDSTDITINGGTIDGGIYHPQDGSLTITGGEITGDSAALEFKSGSLEITGGTLEATNGPALIIENNGGSGYQAIGDVSISGGNFISPENVDAVESITTGSEQAIDNFITGGSFSSDVKEHLADDVEFVTTEDGNTLVGSSIPVVQPTTSSSSSTPTPGAYYNYPRTVSDSGLVEFGTSKVVKSVTLPAGSSGKVNLHIDSTAYWPLAVDSEFTFDISVDNLGVGTSYISFKIAESKLTALDLTAADVGVYHNVNGEWVKLVVTYTIEDGDVIYTAETDSFSPFKLVIEEGAAVQKEEVTPSEPVVDEPVIPDVPQDVPGEVLPEIPDVQDEPETPASPAPVLGLLAALGAAVVLRRK